MKNKKTGLILSLSCIFLGIILTTAGILLGGIPGFYLDKNGIHTARENAVQAMEIFQDTLEVEPFDHIELQANYADVALVPSDRYAVDYRITGVSGAPVCKVEDGRLSFCEDPMEGDPRIWFLYDVPNSAYSREMKPGPYYVKIEYPADTVFSEITVTTECGDLSLPDLQADTVDIRNEYGDVTLKALSGQALTIHMSSGDLSLGNIQAGQTEIRNEYGEVLVGQASGDSLTVDLSSGSFLSNRIDATDIHIKNEYGLVQLGLPGDISAYGYSLYTEYGYLHMDTTTLGGTDDDDGVRYTASGSNGKYIEISCESGDILIQPVP